jgi:hypothetical protein
MPSFSSASPDLRTAQTVLRRTAMAWLLVVIVGQLAFAAYLIGFYGAGALIGDWSRWNKVMPHGYVPGATVFNAVLGLHLLFAAIVVLGGVAQLIAPIRRHAPAVHRWIGRFYIAAAIVMSVGGLMMVWVRGATGDLPQHLAISLNASLIMTCAIAALTQARAKRVDAHRRWALRLFLAVSGVWFFRIGVMFWIVVNGGPVGFDAETFTGPALNVLGVVAYLVPVLLLQAYFLASERAGRVGRWTMAGVLAIAVVVTAIGVVAASALMWWPRLAA